MKLLVFLLILQGHVLSAHAGCVEDAAALTFPNYVFSPATTTFMYGSTLRLNSVFKKAHEALSPAEYELLKAEVTARSGINRSYYPGIMLFDTNNFNDFYYTRYVNLFGSIGKVIAPVGTLGYIIKVNMQSADGRISSDRLKIINGDLVGKRIVGEDLNIGRLTDNMVIIPIGRDSTYAVGYPININGRIENISYKDWTSPDVIQMIQGAGDPADKKIVTVNIKALTP